MPAICKSFGFKQVLAMTAGENLAFVLPSSAVTFLGFTSNLSRSIATSCNFCRESLAYTKAKLHPTECLGHRNDSFGWRFHVFHLAG